MCTLCRPRAGISQAPAGPRRLHRAAPHPPPSRAPPAPGAQAVLAAQGPSGAPAGGAGRRRAPAPQVTLQPRRSTAPAGAASRPPMGRPHRRLAPRPMCHAGHPAGLHEELHVSLPMPRRWFVRPPCRYASSLDPSTITTFQPRTAVDQQQQRGQQQEAQAGLEPLELPNLRPQSAGRSACPWRGPGRRSSDGGGGLLSPPLYAALLQSPIAAPASSGEPCSATEAVPLRQCRSCQGLSLPDE